MAIFLTADSKVIVQGMTGSEGMKHTTRMLASGTNVVGGVNPKKAGQSVDFPGGQSVPVFGSVADAIKETGADVSVIFVPPAFAKDAAIEAIEAEIPLLVVITEGIPVQDSAEFWAEAKKAGKTRIIGPNCPGIITPEMVAPGAVVLDVGVSRVVDPATGKGRIAGDVADGRGRRPGRAGTGVAVGDDVDVELLRVGTQLAHGVPAQARLLARDLGDTAARELILANAALVAEWLEVARSATSKT